MAAGCGQSAGMRAISAEAPGAARICAPSGTPQKRRAAAIKVAKALGPGHRVVTLLCDGGARYQSKLFNPEFLRGKGLPHLNGPGVGDQLVRVIAWTPTDLTKSQIERMRALQEELAGQVPEPGRHIYD